MTHSFVLIWIKGTQFFQSDKNSTHLLGRNISMILMIKKDWAMTHSFVLIWIKRTQFFSLIKTQGINSYFGGRQRKSGRWSCSCFLAVCNHCFVQIKKSFPKISISLSDITLHPKSGVLDSNSQTYFLLVFFPFFLLLFLSLSLEKMGLLKSNSQIFFLLFFFFFFLCLSFIFIFVFGENGTA